MRWLNLQACVLASSTLFSVAPNILQIVQNALQMFGYPAVVLFIMIESSGIPFPGETMLLLAAFYAATNHTLSIPLVIACASLGAIVGDNIGYALGLTGGKALVQRYGRYVFIKPHHLERAEKFFAKHGNKTVFFGRFIAVLRAWSAFLAGVNHMPWGTFLLYNATGGILWATLFGCIGYYAGILFQGNFAKVEHLASTITWTIGGVIAAIVVLLLCIYYIRRKKETTLPKSRDDS